MKKVCGLLFIILACFSLTACGAGKEGGENKDGGQSEAAESRAKTSPETSEESSEPVSREESQVVSQALSSEISDRESKEGQVSLGGSGLNDPATEQDNPPAYDPHGELFTDPYQMGEKISHRRRSGEVIEYSVDKVYRDDAALALVNPDEAFLDYKATKLPFAGLADRYLVIEISQTFAAHEKDKRPEPYEDRFRGKVGVYEANTQPCSSLFLESPVVEGYQIAPLPLGESQKFYYLVAYEEGTQEPKFISLEGLYIVDIAPDVEAALVKEGEKATGNYRYFADGDDSTLLETPIFEAILKSVETGKAVKEEYWSTAGGTDIFSKDDDRVNYLKAVLEINFNPEEDVLAEGAEPVVISYIHPMMQGYQYASAYPDLVLEMEDSGLEDTKEVVYLHPGEAKEIKLYLAFSNILPAGKYPRLLNLFGYMTFVMDYEVE